MRIPTKPQSYQCASPNFDDSLMVEASYPRQAAVRRLSASNAVLRRVSRSQPPCLIVQLLCYVTHLTQADKQIAPTEGAKG